MFTTTGNILSLWNKMYATRGSHSPESRRVYESRLTKPLLKEIDERLEKTGELKSMIAAETFKKPTTKKPTSATEELERQVVDFLLQGKTKTKTIPDDCEIKEVDGKRYVVYSKELTGRHWEEVSKLQTGQRVLMKSEHRNWAPGTIYRGKNNSSEVRPFVINEVHLGAVPTGSAWQKYGTHSWILNSKEGMLDDGTRLLLIKEEL